MKKIFCLSITILLILLSGTTAFANTIHGQEESKQFIIERYDELFEKNNGDHEAALNELIACSDSLELVANEDYYFTADGEEWLPVTKSTMADIQLSDSLIHDNDWNTYVYIGTWDWLNYPDEVNLQPWDIVGFSTDDPSCIYAEECFVYGYTNFGVRTIYYNSETDSTSGPISLGTTNQYGSAFWHNEEVVDNGRITIPLSYTSGSNAKIRIVYGHSFTTTSITGVGGEVGIGSGGFNISWETGVQHWEDIKSTWGVSIP